MSLLAAHFGSMPRGRSRESVQRQYEVERRLADRLKRGTPEERAALYSRMYDELFAAVPDHPRLVRRDDPQRTSRANTGKMALLRRVLGDESVVLEFAPGDCRFAAELSGRVRRVYAVDISDQTGGLELPDNVRLVLYDGREVELPEPVDIAFSDQLIEHLHPEDTSLHFALVHRLLKPGGVYVVRTPHRLTGPHDISRGFSDHAEGFHLKEWTYGELSELILASGFRQVLCYWSARGWMIRLPLRVLRAVESFGVRLPLIVRQHLLRVLLPSLTLWARK